MEEEVLVGAGERCNQCLHEEEEEGNEMKGKA